MTATDKILALKHQAWRTGDLSFLLLDHQIELLEIIDSRKDRITAINCSRRWGKSRFFITYAFWKALLKPNAQIMYAAPTRVQVQMFLLPHAKEILATCPPELQPKYSGQDHTWTFPNGSIVRVAGCDKGNAEYLRGTHADLFILDEAGMIEDLTYVVKSIALPQTLTCDGRVIAVSTPPKSPSHPFKDMCLSAMEENRYIHRDIYTATHVTPEMIEEYKKEVGGEKSTDWRREFLGQFVTDADSAILPEFQENLDTIIQDIPTPEYRNCYVSSDFGFKDMTFVVFGYWHFELAKLVIEDELVFTATGSDTIAHAIMEKENTLWSKPPKLRIADCDPIILSDLRSRHSLNFLKTRRDDLEAQVTALRVLITQDKLRIHPRCKQLIEHLSNGIWDTTGLKFARSGKHGHFDGVAAMVYLVRNVNTRANPTPETQYNPATHHVPRNRNKSTGVKKAFRPLWRR